jgi:hypothetical protein
MFRAIGIAVGMWGASTALTYAHYRFCFPWFTIAEPCLSIQRSSVFLNTTIQNYGYMAVGLLIDATLKLMPPVMRKPIKEKTPKVE